MTETMTQSRFEIVDVVEIAETHSRQVAQLYLDAGYRLLNVGVTHSNRKRLDGDGSAVWRSNEYVLGRDAVTPSLPMADAVALVRASRPPRAEKPE